LALQAAAERSTSPPVPMRRLARTVARKDPILAPTRAETLTLARMRGARRSTRLLATATFRCRTTTSRAPSIRIACCPRATSPFNLETTVSGCVSVAAARSTRMPQTSTSQTFLARCWDRGRFRGWPAAARPTAGHVVSVALAPQIVQASLPTRARRNRSILEPLRDDRGPSPRDWPARGNGQVRWTWPLTLTQTKRSPRTTGVWTWLHAARRGKRDQAGVPFTSKATAPP
jgi:hypothetical protein